MLFSAQCDSVAIDRSKSLSQPFFQYRSLYSIRFAVGTRSAAWRCTASVFAAECVRAPYSKEGGGCGSGGGQAWARLEFEDDVVVDRQLVLEHHRQVCLYTRVKRTTAPNPAVVYKYVRMRDYTTVRNSRALDVSVLRAFLTDLQTHCLPWVAA